MHYASYGRPHPGDSCSGTEPSQDQEPNLIWRAKCFELGLVGMGRPSVQSRGKMSGLPDTHVTPIQHIGGAKGWVRTGKAFTLRLPQVVQVRVRKTGTVARGGEKEGHFRDGFRRLPLAGS